MAASLRVNEALLIAHRAFQPFQCIAWSMQDNTRELSLSVVDRGTCTVLGRARISSSVYSDPEKLAELLKESRAELCKKGYQLQEWSMA